MVHHEMENSPFFRDNEKLLPKKGWLSSFMLLGQRLISVDCLMIMIDAVGCGGGLLFSGTGYDAYC